MLCSLDDAEGILSPRCKRPRSLRSLSRSWQSMKQVSSTMWNASGCILLRYSDGYMFFYQNNLFGYTEMWGWLIGRVHQFWQWNIESSMYVSTRRPELVRLHEWSWEFLFDDNLSYFCHGSWKPAFKARWTVVVSFGTIHVNEGVRKVIIQKRWILQRLHPTNQTFVETIVKYTGSCHCSCQILKTVRSVASSKDGRKDVGMEPSSLNVRLCRVEKDGSIPEVTTYFQKVMLCSDRKAANKYWPKWVR